MPCPTLAKVSGRQSFPETSKACSPRCGCAAPQPSEGAEPASSEAHIFPRSPGACQETRVSGTSPGEASASQCGAGASSTRGQRLSPELTSTGSSKGEGQRGGPEERFGAGCVPCAGCTAASAQNLSGQEGEAVDEGCTGAASWGAAGPATSHLPGHPRQLVQPCGTIVPFLQAHRDAPAVLVLPEPNVSALPALGDPPWPELPVCSTAGGRQHGAAGSGFGGPHSLWESLAVFPSGVSLSARQRQC